METESLALAKMTYHSEGWCRASIRLEPREVAALLDRVNRLSTEVRSEVVYENGTDVVRAIHGCHRYDDMCARLVRLPRLLHLAEALIGQQVYVYQFKVNLKQPGTGAAWPWHQDFAFWQEEDGMPAASAVNIAVLLDDVRESNGPLILVPRSHRMGLFDLPQAGSGVVGRDWHEHVSANLTYTVGTERAAGLAAKNGTRAVVGTAGDVWAFHPSIVHSSSENLSPHRRALLLITYNSVSNRPTRLTRPAFLVDPDTRPLTGLTEDRLVQ
jgi:ectoine hydroxylase